MDLAAFRTFCLTLRGVEETYPFGPQAMWFKVGGKAFGWTFVEDFKMDGEMRPPFYFVNLKCDPGQALLWREANPEVEGGWHQSKKHWNSVYTDGALSDDAFKQMIEHAHGLVLAALPKKIRLSIEGDE